MIQKIKYFRSRRFISALCCITVIGAAALLFLTSEPEENKESPEQRDITAEEIEEINAAFKQLIPVEGKENQFYVNPICHFFSNHYEDVRDMDMGDFVYYIERESYLGPENQGEIQELTEAGFELPFKSAENMPVPMGRIPYETVDAYLNRYADTGLEDMRNMGHAIYSDERRCFYSYASDFGAGLFYCSSGSIDGDIITLYSQSTESFLKIKKDGDRYFILSHTAKKQS